MDLFCLDYTEQYYATVSNTGVPARRKGKFVQIRHEDAEYLVMSPEEFLPYHADLVKFFCREREIEGVYIDSEKRFEILDQTWSIIGGGKFEIDEEAKYLYLYDNSMAYGKFDAKGIGDKLRQMDRLSDYEVRIG